MKSVTVLLAPLVGAVLAVVVMFGLIWSQTKAPDTNPVSQSSIEQYGN
ncbi:hypothetical protein [Nocardioides marinquilinus]